MSRVKYKECPKVLTFVIRNDAPLVCAGSTPKYRTVRIELTDDQVRKVRLKHVGTAAGTEIFEEISLIIPDECSYTTGKE